MHKQSPRAHAVLVSSGVNVATVGGQSFVRLMKRLHGGGGREGRARLFPPVHDEPIGSESVSSRRKNPTVDVELVPASSPAGSSSLHTFQEVFDPSLTVLWGGGDSPSSQIITQVMALINPLTGCTRSIGPAARVNSLMYPVHSVFYDDRRAGGPGRGEPRRGRVAVYFLNSRGGPRRFNHSRRRARPAGRVKKCQSPNGVAADSFCWPQRPSRIPIMFVEGNL